MNLTAPDVPIDFLGLWKLQDEEWADVEFRNAVPLEGVLYQFNRNTQQLRGIWVGTTQLPDDADIRFL